MASNLELKSIHQYEYTSISGEKVSFETYKGKYILIVNVASECGFTPQYEDLQKLYEKYQDKLVIVGFPCNQFGHQEPGNEAEIQSFCKKNYGVTFPLSEKVDVKGDEQCEVYQFLTKEELNGHSSSKVKWNFHKYLLNPEGEIIEVMGSMVKPFDEDIIKHLEQ